MEPTTERCIDINERDPKKGKTAAIEMLKKENLPVTDENIFIAATCKEKGILYLTGKAKVNGVRSEERGEEGVGEKACCRPGTRPVAKEAVNVIR